MRSHPYKETSCRTSGPSEPTHSTRVWWCSFNDLRQEGRAHRFSPVITESEGLNPEIQTSGKDGFLDLLELRHELVQLLHDGSNGVRLREVDAGLLQLGHRVIVSPG